MDKVLFHIKVQCEKCEGKGRVVPIEVQRYMSQISRVGITASKKRELWQEFLLQHQYHPEEKMQGFCENCNGTGHREEWVKLIDVKQMLEGQK